MVNKLVGALLLTASLSFTTGQAAVLTWGAPTTVSGDTDVSASGTLVGAVNLIDFGSSTTAKTVNGVSFTAWEASVSPNTSGIFSFPKETVGAYRVIGAAAESTAPFSGLSPNYKDLQRDGAQLRNGSLLTISGLTIGQSYLFQWWSTVPDNPPTSNFMTPSTATAGNQVTLNPNLTNAAGGLGQFAIGSFTADNATQTIAFSAGATISAMQVRSTSPSSSVPDAGSTLVLFGVALATVAGVRRRLQR